MLPSFDYIMPSILDNNGFSNEPNISPAHSPNIIRRTLISRVSSSPAKIPTNNFESLDIKPSSSLNLDDLQKEEKYQKTHIFAYKPPRGLCIPVLHALLRLSMTPRDNGNDKSNSSLFPVYSAIVLPNEPNTIFIECESEQAARNALKHIAELRPIRNMVEITKSQFPNVFLNPIKSLKYHIGKIIQTKNPEFDNEFGQIVDIDPTKGKLLVKILPHIDYNELIMYNLNSQKVLNNKKPPDYKAPSTVFDEHRILGLNLATKNFERKQIRIWGKMFDAIIWDKKTFIGQFQYVWLDFNEVSFPGFVEPIDFERFEKGMSSFERENSVFVTNFNERSNRCTSHEFECNDKILEIHKNTGKPSWAPKSSPSSLSIELNDSNNFLSKRKGQSKARISAFPVKLQEQPPLPQNSQSETKSQTRSFLDSDDPDIDEEIINEIENKSKNNNISNSQPQTTQPQKTNASNLQNQSNSTTSTTNEKSNTQQTLNNQPSQQLANTQSQETQVTQYYYKFADLINQRNKEQLNELNMQIESQKNQKYLLFTYLLKIEKLNGYGCEYEEEQISRILNGLNKKQEDLRQKEDKQVKELLDILNYISPKVVATIQKTNKKALKKPLEDKLSGLETYLRTLEESIKNYKNDSIQSNHNTYELELFKYLTVFQINLTKQRMVLKQQADEIEQSKKPENRINLLLSLIENNQQYAQALHFELQNQPEKLSRIYEIQRQKYGHAQENEIQQQYQLQQQQMYNAPLYYQQQQLFNGQNGYQQYYQQYQMPIQTTQLINQLQQPIQQVQQPIQPMQQVQQPMQQIQQPIQQVQQPIQQMQQVQQPMQQVQQPIQQMQQIQRVQQQMQQVQQPIQSMQQMQQNQQMQQPMQQVQQPIQQIQQPIQSMQQMQQNQQMQQPIRQNQQIQQPMQQIQQPIQQNQQIQQHQQIQQPIQRIQQPMQQIQQPIQQNQQIQQPMQQHQQMQQQIQQNQQIKQQMQQQIQQNQQIKQPMQQHQQMQQLMRQIQQNQQSNSQNIPQTKSINSNQFSQPTSDQVAKKQRIQQKKVKGNQPTISIESYFQNYQTPSQEANAQFIPHLNLSTNQANTINSSFLSSIDQKSKKQTRRNQLNVVVQNINQKK